MLPVKLLGGEGSHAMEVLFLVSVLPADGLRRAAETNANHPEHLDGKHTVGPSIYQQHLIAVLCDACLFAQVAQQEDVLDYILISTKLSISNLGFDPTNTILINHHCYEIPPSFAPLSSLRLFLSFPLFVPHNLSSCASSCCVKE